MSINKYSYYIRQTKEIKKKKTSDKIIYHMIFIAIYCIIKIHFNIGQLFLLS